MLTIPVPIIGTTIGLCIGVFVGALIGEMSVRDDTAHSIRVGIAATKAHIYAIIIKLLFSIAMLGIVAIKAAPFKYATQNVTTTSTPKVNWLSSP